MSIQNVSTQFLDQVTTNDSPKESGYNGDGFYYTTYPFMVQGRSRLSGLTTQTGMPLKSVQELAIAGTKRLGDYAPSGMVTGTPSIATGAGGTSF